MMLEKKKLKPIFYSMSILGVRVDFFDLKEFCRLTKKWIKSNKQYQITTPNPEQIVLAQENMKFRDIINKSALAIPDGIGVVFTAWLFRLKERNSHGKQVKLQRISGIDLMEVLCRLAVDEGWRVFLLGGRGDTASLAACFLRREILLKKIEFSSGIENIRKESKEERERLIKKINNFKPEILFVAFGAPWQEEWISCNLPKLKVKIAMGVGGSFDFLSRRVRRAPKCVREIGFEWLYRLLVQPWRFRRQVKLFEYVRLVVKSLIFKN